jgi:hypothetical protein
MFVDPIADVAILACPDEQELSDEADAYCELTGNAHVLQIADAKGGQGWVLSVKGNWIRTALELASGFGALSIDPTEAGMSGSPVLNDADLHPNKHRLRGKRLIHLRQNGTAAACPAPSPPQPTPSTRPNS